MDPRVYKAILDQAYDSEVNTVDKWRENVNRQLRQAQQSAQQNMINADRERLAQIAYERT